MRIHGITSGCYDLTHYYHLDYWRRCKEYCDLLFVGVDSDRLVKSVKGDSRPIFEQKHRLALVENSRYVDGVFLMDTIEDFARASNEIEADIIFKNQDFVNVDIVGCGLGAKVMYINDVDVPDEITSTSEFIKKIKST